MRGMYIFRPGYECLVRGSEGKKTTLKDRRLVEWGGGEGEGR